MNSHPISGGIGLGFGLALCMPHLLFFFFSLLFGTLLHRSGFSDCRIQGIFCDTMALVKSFLAFSPSFGSGIIPVLLPFFLVARFLRV